MSRVQDRSFWPARQLLSALTLTVLLSAAGAALGHAGHRRSQAVKPTPDELAAYAAAKPAFERHCFRCHTTSGQKAKAKPKALEHLAMDRYPFGGHHADEAAAAIRKALGVGVAAKATMPSDDPGTVAGDDLAKIVQWAEAFDRAHPHEPVKPKPVNTTKEKPHAH